MYITVHTLKRCYYIRYQETPKRTNNNDRPRNTGNATLTKNKNIKTPNKQAVRSSNIDEQIKSVGFSKRKKSTKERL